MRQALARHWPEYLMEAAGLGFFMVSACAFATVLEHPVSPLRHAIPDALARRILMGLAMGATAAALTYSPWGQQSGAHFNPAVTLTFLRLGKVRGWDALFYVAAQFGGALCGVALAAALIGGALADPSVHYVVTRPSAAGPALAFVAETVISFGLMIAVLTVSNIHRVARFTGVVAACLVATYISVEAPCSGMSMNPARTFAPALAARFWMALWVYFTAPPLGMLLAAETYQAVRGGRAVRCAKLHHDNAKRCIFRCGYGA